MLLAESTRLLSLYIIYLSTVGSVIKHNFQSIHGVNISFVFHIIGMSNSIFIAMLSFRHQPKQFSIQLKALRAIAKLNLHIFDQIYRRRNENSISITSPINITKFWAHSIEQSRHDISHEVWPPWWYQFVHILVIAL